MVDFLILVVQEIWSIKEASIFLLFGFALGLLVPAGFTRSLAVR